MSEIKINPIPIGIPIRYSKSWHSFSNPQGGVQKYLFELTINYDSTNKKIFRKIESDKHCDLIEQEDNIKYNEVKILNYLFLNYLPILVLIMKQKV